MSDYNPVFVNFLTLVFNIEDEGLNFAECLFINRQSAKKKEDVNPPLPFSLPPKNSNLVNFLQN